MYLERIKSKGNYYIYLRMYDQTITYSKNKKTTLYGFGRYEKAIKNMKKWERDFKQFPEELKALGCTRDDLGTWINKLEPRPRNRQVYVAT
ncbi:hypothetical protein X953_19910 (plasmid) [Virgibacillus sp. SK37]|nr:hypothetical protein X953_19910 [Virgibacillus sp. SK37]